MIHHEVVPTQFLEGPSLLVPYVDDMLLISNDTDMTEKDKESVFIQRNERKRTLTIDQPNYLESFQES